MDEKAFTMYEFLQELEKMKLAKDPGNQPKSPESNLTLKALVEKKFNELFSNDHPPEFIEKISTIKYSQDEFGIEFPMITQDPGAAANLYYPKPFEVNSKMYFAYSAWEEKHRLLLKKWFINMFII